jgi:ribosomal protein S18 acetylase RimI-like enzyme
VDRDAGVLLRPSRPEDVPALVDVFVTSFQRGYRHLLPAEVLAGVDRPTVTGWFSGWSTTPDPVLRTMVAEIDSTPYGFVRFGDGSADDTADVPPVDGGAEPGRVAYIAALYVHPDAAGRGVGRLLVEHAVTELAAAGYRVVTLWVFADNARARGLYSSTGFVPDGAEITDPRWRVRQIRMRREGIGA